MDAFKPVWLRARQGLSFTLFRDGRPAEIGDLADLEQTPLGPLQGWTDLVAAGVDPRRVKLVSYSGTPTSRTECMLALALGARVGLVEDAALPKDRQFDEPEWQDCPNLLRLPLDAMTLRAFLLTDQLPCKRDELARAAERSHEEHVRSVISQEPGLLPWKDLSEDLKLSNFHQVAYAEDILNTAGFGVRPMDDPQRPLVDLQAALGEEGLSRLAEMEHGRWNVERLLSGWRHAETKDVVKKHSPYLVPWNKLPLDVRQYDLNVIRGLPARFREAGLEVYHF